MVPLLSTQTLAPAAVCHTHGHVLRLSLPQEILVLAFVWVQRALDQVGPLPLAALSPLLERVHLPPIK